MNNFCILSIIKNEHKYLEEWIQYHINLGINKIYLFEDIDSESHLEITKKYKEVSLLSVLDLYTEKEDIIDKRRQGKFLQVIFLKKAFIYIKNIENSGWCFVIDTDEFVALNDNNTLSTVLEFYKTCKLVVLKWKNYGASGYIKSPGESVKYYTKECCILEKDSLRYTNNKIAYNLNSGINLRYHHATKNQYRIYLSDKIYIKHYITKSWEDYVWKLTKRGMSCSNNRTINDFFEYNPELMEQKEKLINTINYVLDNRIK